jgi:hypothetical protein
LPALAKSIAARSIGSDINVNTGGVSLSIKLQRDGGHFLILDSGSLLLPLQQQTRSREYL